jgi:hypothetical protein
VNPTAEGASSTFNITSHLDSPSGSYRKEKNGGHPKTVSLGAAIIKSACGDVDILLYGPVSGEISPKGTREKYFELIQLRRP